MLARRFIWALVFCVIVPTIVSASEAPKPSVDIVLGPHLTGRDFLALNEVAQTYYVVGVYDAFRAVEAEAAYQLIVQLMEGSANRREDKSPADITLSLIGKTLAQTPPFYVSVKGIVREYITSRPLEHDLPAALLIWRALAEADWD